jgi:hypothetical protein
MKVLVMATCIGTLSGFGHEGMTSVTNGTLNLTIPSGNMLVCASCVKQAIRDQYPNAQLELFVDVSFPSVKMRIYENSLSSHRSIFKNISDLLLSHLDLTNSGYGIGNNVGPLNAKQMSWHDVVYFFESCFGCKVTYRDNFIIIHVFPDVLEVIEYRQRSNKGMTVLETLRLGYVSSGKIRDGVFLDCSGSQKECSLVVATPEGHNQAMKQLKEFGGGELAETIVAPNTQVDLKIKN